MAQIPIIKLSGEMVGAGFLGTGEQSLLSLLISWRANRIKENVESFLEADSLFTLAGSILKKFFEIDDSCKIHLGKLNTTHHIYNNLSHIILVYIINSYPVILVYVVE